MVLVYVWECIRIIFDYDKNYKRKQKEKKNEAKTITLLSKIKQTMIKIIAKIMMILDKDRLSLYEEDNLLTGQE